jgi:dipeptidyl aminopeptidase/acylaminoacyl peptidase
MPEITSVHASGDGAWAFWCWDGMHETAEVYAVPADASRPPERLTHGTDHYSIRDVNHDGSRLILAQSRNANEHDQLILLDRALGNRLTALTPEQSDHYVYGGRFTPDGRHICFIADHDYTTAKVTSGGWVYLQDLTNGTRQVIARSDSPFEDGPTFSPSGGHLLWHRHERSPGGTQLWLMGADGSNLREVLSLGERQNIKGHWLDDDRITVVAEGPDGDRVGILTLATGSVNWLAGEPQIFPHDTLAGRNGTFACIAHREGALETMVLNADTGTIAPLPNTSGRGSLLPHASLPDGGWIAEAYDAGAPHELVRIMPDGQVLRLATPPDLPGARHIRPTNYRWTSPDGSQCQGHLYRPDGPSKGLVTWVHGGPTWHTEDWVYARVGFLVQQGFTVLDPNYRGSTGFGRAWREAVKDDGWGGREQDDIRAGIEALIADGLAERGRIAVAGNSYGGYSSWVAITRFADLVTAAIPMCGMYRLDIDYGATEMPHGRAYSEEMMGGRPDEAPEKYRAASPGNFIDRIRGHVLIVHGLADSNVGPENTHAAIRELTAAGIPHQTLLFENEGHGINRRSNVAVFFDRMARFLEGAFDQGPWRPE